MEKVIWKKGAVVGLGAALLTMLSLPLSAQQVPAGSATTGTDQQQGNGVLSSPSEQAAPAQQPDTDFMQRAYQATRAQVDMGYMAIQNAHSEQVKEYARKAVSDFTRAGQELQAIAGPATPQNNLTGQALAQQDNRNRSNYERQQYPYLKNNPHLLEEMENFNVGGSGLGTSGGTTGTAVSRPARPKNPTNSTSDRTGVGMGTGTPMGMGSGEVGNTDSIPDQLVNTTTNMTHENASGISDSRTGRTAPQSQPGVGLSESLPADYQTTRNKLFFLNGPEFDREYLKAAGNYHNQLMDMLQVELSTGGDQPAKQWAEKYLTLMRENQPPVLGNGKAQPVKEKASSDGW